MATIIIFSFNFGNYSSQSTEKTTLPIQTAY